MEFAIKKAGVKDARALAAMDRRCFPNKEDHSPPSYFKTPGMRSFWITYGSRRIGAMSLMHHRTYSVDQYTFAEHCHGSLYLTSTGITVANQRKGIGAILKAWQIAYARRLRFGKIVTHARVSNIASINLNVKFGFTAVGLLRKYYGETEDAVLLEFLVL